MKSSFAIDTRPSCTRFPFFERKRKKEKKKRQKKKRQRTFRIDLDLRKVVAVQACDVCAVRIREN